MDLAGVAVPVGRGARVISRLRGYDGAVRGHGVVLYENRLGGRVAVVPFDSQGPATVSLGAAFAPLESPSFVCWPRQAQLAAVLEWAGREPLPLTVVGAPCAYPVLAEQEGRAVVGVVNLSPDPIPSLVLRLARPPARARRVRVLDERGQWRAPRGVRVKAAGRGGVEIDTGIPLRYLDVAAVIVE